MEKIILQLIFIIKIYYIDSQMLCVSHSISLISNAVICLVPAEDIEMIQTKEKSHVNTCSDK